MDKPEKRPPGSGLRKLTAFSGGAAFILGAMGLAGWITGSRVLASLRPDYIPMAPDTGLLFMALGAILLSGAYDRDRGRDRSLAVAVASLASFYGALESVETFFGVDLTLQRVIFPNPGRLGAIVLGRMSPVAGLLFFLSGLALLARLLGRARRAPREAASGLGAVVLVAGGVATTGYLFGTPLLYGGATIPLAATTSTAFLVLGLGLTAAAGKDTVLARELSGPSASARLLRSILPIIVLAILLDGLLDAWLADVIAVNRAFLSAILTLASMVVIVIVVIRVARSVFRSAEQAEAERTRAEEQLLIKEAALASSMSAIGLASMDGILIYANKAYIDLWGGGREEELLGQPLSGFAGYEEPVREVVEALMAGKGYVGEKVALLKDGRERVVQLSANVVTSSDGRPICMMASFLDVTERRRAEEELRKGEKLYRLLAENMKDVVWTLDPATMRFTYVSPSVESLRGYTPEEVLARPVYDALMPEARESFRQRVEESLAGFLADPGEDHSSITTVAQPCKDGSTVLTEVVTRFYRDEETGKVLVHGVTRDITERKRTEEQLLVKGFALESSMSAIGLADMEGKIIYVNAAYVKLWGYDRKEEILGKPISEFALSTEWVREAVETMSAGREYVGEGISRKKDGTEFAIMLSTNLVTSPEGRPICMMASINDITERKKAEEALRDSVRKTEILMKELQHRVKNSLAVVSGLLGLGLETLTDERAKGIFAETRSRIRSISSLYEQLYSTEDPVNVDLGRYIRQLAESLFKTYVPGTRGIRLKMTLAEVRLDTKRAVPLGLILNELVTNSLKYGYPAGATGEVRIDLARSGDTVALGVSDDGPGLPAGFDPMASGGMGWSLVRMLAEEIGGDVSLPAGARGTRVLVRFKP
jgi:PAS domain S-box-containing protein